MYPVRVVVDQHDGYTIWRDRDGELLTEQTAAALAAQHNDHMRPEHRRWAVFALVPADGPAEGLADALAAAFPDGPLPEAVEILDKRWAIESSALDAPGPA